MAANLDELLARIREAPDDDAPRLVLADALLERGDLWGQVIALSCEAARRPEAEAQELREQVYELRAERWSKAFVGTMVRGFFDRVWANDAGVGAIVGPEFTFVRELRVRNLTDAGLRALAKLPVVTADALILDAFRSSLERPTVSPGLVIDALERVRCRMLEVRTIDLSRAELDRLFAHPLARELRDLRIGGAQLTGSFAGIAWPPLEALAISIGVQSPDVIALLRSERLHDLCSLALSYNAIDDVAADAIASTPFTQLASLELCSTNITGAGLARLAAAPPLRTLARFAIGCDRDIDVEDLACLAQLDRLTDLELELGSTPAAVARFYAQLRAPLRRFVARIAGVEGVDAVPPLESPAFRELRILQLSHQALFDAGARALAAADLPFLERLDLDGCQIGPDGIGALAQSQTLPRGLQLSLFGSDPGEHAEALRARYHVVTLSGA